MRSGEALRIRVGRLILKVLSLERIIASKMATDRQKDRLILHVLRDALATIKGTAVSHRRGSRDR